MTHLVRTRVILSAPLALLLWCVGSGRITAESFPDVGIMPKQEIGALEWLKQHPEYDGRGVVVAIFDTGVDPGAAGLQQTSDGKPKVIDMIDGTGSGDVATTMVKEATGDTLAGLTGRTLKLNRKWLAKGRKFHLGLKAAYEFYPDELVPRIKRSRKKAFDKQQAALETQLRRDLAAFDKAHGKPNAEQKRKREELQARLDVLIAAGKAYDDPGPIFDCVVFHDGKVWRAVVDTDADGDLAEEKAMTNYRDELQWSTFGGGAELNFGVNIFEQGNRLSIVADGHPHGTHVAGIVAGNFPGQPELNGVAPGAQIVSIKIGDTRLGGMETAAGLERGIIRTIQDKCDVINMSFGEPTRTPNAGKIPELCADAVNNHGIIFVASAGNAGPALSTVGAPGATTSAILGVGAYVSDAMARAEYTLREKIEEGPYTFTSLGPAFDGAMGVDIAAPGGAIAPIPTWTLNRSMQMNGTSMASPNCAGAIALILSAAKANDIPFTPYSVRKAIQNTARDVPKSEVFAEGPGLIQVPAAYGHLKQFATAMGEEVDFDVRVTSSHNARGIYLRETHEVAKAANHTINVKPMFRDEDDNARKLAFEMRFRLQSTQDWVKTGDAMFMNYSGKRFRIEVDPTELPPGVHYAEVQGMDAENEGRGPLFRLPITVIIPETVPMPEGTVSGSEDFTPGRIVRRFISVPHGATWMDLKLRRPGGHGSRLIVAHTLQRLEGWSNEDGEHQKYAFLGPDAEAMESIAVVGGRTLELCLTQYWWSLGETAVEYEVAFHGVETDDRHLELSAGDAPRRVLLRSPFRKTTIGPAASLTTHRQVVHPAKAEIRPLSSERDLIPDGRQIYEAQVTFRFHQAKSGTVVPRLPLTDGLLYDATIGPHLWQLYDRNQRLLRTDDIWPDDAGPLRLAKGPHTLVVWIRSTQQSHLAAAKNMVLYLDRSLSSPLSIGVFADRSAADAGGPRFSSEMLQVGQILPIYVAAPKSSQLPAAFGDGDLLLGSISYAKASSSQEGAGKRPGGYPLVVTGKKKSSGSSGATGAPKKNALAEQILDLKVNHLKSLSEKDQKAFDEISAEILKQKPNYMPVLVARLHRMDHEAKRKERLADVVAAADAVIAQVDAEALATHFGTNLGTGSEAQKLRAKLTKQRDILIDALYRKGRALGYMELPEVLEKHPITDQDAHNKAFEDNFAELAKWVDTRDPKYALLHIRKERRQQRYGKALSLLNQRIQEMGAVKLLDKKRRDMYESLEWEHLRQNADDWMLRRFPHGPQPF